MARLVSDVQGCLQTDILIHTSSSPAATNRIEIGESWNKKHIFLAVVVLRILQGIAIIHNSLASHPTPLCPSTLPSGIFEKKDLARLNTEGLKLLKNKKYTRPLNYSCLS